MEKLFTSFLVFLLLCSVAFSQGIVRGKITDENGESVPGANIILKSQPTVGTVSDLKGQFSLKISSSTPQTILVSFLSYQTIEETVNPKNGEIIIKNFNLVPASLKLEDAVIVGKANKSKEVYMEKIKARSVLSIDYISSETIKRTGDVNVSSAVARVTGVSTSGSFITVRGVGDRYMKTAINGSRIPTLDPFTNNIKLDLFPASLIDNIVITKTASPDLPGDWAGAYLSIETKDYPEKLSVNVETSFGYNQQSTFKDVVTSQRSATDWLGYDNGLRDINHADFVPVDQNQNGSSTITTYDEYVALGLGDYFKSIGVTETNWNQNQDTYNKLGLIQLGLLPANQFSDNTAYTNAKNLYASNYQKHADNLVNAPAIKSQSRLFPDNWNTSTRKAPLNFSQSFSIGNQTTLFGRTLGYLAGFRYSSSIQYDPNSIGHKYDALSNDSTLSQDTAVLHTCKETNGWSALINLAYKYHPNHSISLLFMPNLIGVNMVRNGLDYNNKANTSTSLGTTEPVQDQFYESRKQMVYQLKSEHYVPGLGLKIELNASYTNAKSSAPDFKHVEPGSAKLDRFYRYLSENLFDSRLFAELPLGKPTEAGTSKLKFGVAYQFNNRKNDQYDYIFQQKTKDELHRVVDSTLNGWYTEYNNPTNHSLGHAQVKAGFIMIDYPLSPLIRFSGGVRVEQANIYTDVALYDSLGLSANDLRRQFDLQLPLAKAGSLNKPSVLPSANLIIKLNRNEVAPVNVRLNYSQTVARPSMRELSEVVVYDYEFKVKLLGNDSLKMVQIHNYDARFEAYFESGDNISVSAFYKSFKNHIEFYKIGNNPDQIGLIWLNSPNAWLKGIELEGKKNITKQLELRANVTLVDSRTKVRPPNFNNGSLAYTDTTITHTMLGQAPYVINGILSYSSDKMGLSAALSYNVQGPRLVIVGLHTTSYVPDIYEMPRHLLDFKATKSIGKHFSVSIKVLDILNSPVRRAYKFNGSEIHNLYNGYNVLDYDKYTWGTSYVFTLAYKL